MLETLQNLEREILQERDLQKEHMQKQWARPLDDRIDSGRALGHLRIESIDPVKNLIHFTPPAEDFAFFHEQQRVRLSQNSPESHFFRAIFLGLTNNGLTLACSQCDNIDFQQLTGWSIDEDLIDVSDFYLKGLKALAEEAHGRDKVFPFLFEGLPSTIHGETYDSIMDALENSSAIKDHPLNDSQQDAIAIALASSPMHLIQGPPGTGKTQTLAELVERLVLEGHRILVTGFTHRSIHNALEKIHTLLDGLCPVVKISAPLSEEPLPFPIFSSFEESELDTSAGPYVIGATPFALFTRRLQAAHFDSAVLDETSQLTLPAAIMVMMKSDRWFFFGDDQQLPPVSFVHRDNPADASVFCRLKQQTEPSTLTITYRMNAPLTHWPSENFYHGELTSHFADKQLALQSTPRRYGEFLDPDQSLVSTMLPCEFSKSRNDDEADLTAALIEELLNCGLSPDDIGVVTPFRAQASRIRTLLRNVIAPPYKHIERKLAVDTVDRFQGQEREVIIYSFTASDPAFIRKLHTFLFQQARLNVAVTRAKTKVILIHSKGLLRQARKLAPYDESASLFLSLLDQAQSVNPTPHGETFS